MGETNKGSRKDKGTKTRFRATLLGRPKFFVRDDEGNKHEVKLRSRQSVALLAYLQSRGRGVSRDRVIDLLWHEDDGVTARSSLRVLLARLKKLLPGVLAVDNQMVSLEPESIVWDTREFDALLERGSVVSLTKAALLYEGEFMQDFDLGVSSEFEPWLDAERLQWHERYNMLMRKLVDLFVAQGRGSKARFYIERWGRLEPDSEAAYRQQMWLAWKEGKTEPAYAHYQKLVRKLENELGVGPEASTQGLFEKIVQSGEQEKTLTEIKNTGVPASAPLEQRAGAADIDPHALYLSNLELTSFAGRTHELAQLTALLRQRRLITVHGMGGVGKTRLTLEACRALRQDFGDSIFVFACEAYKADIFATRLETLAVSLQASTAPVLVLLDSFDLLHLTHMPVLELIRTAPHATILVTSREPLGILGEGLLELTPLPLPDPADTNTLRANSAVQLFYQRAPLSEEIGAALPGTLRTISRIVRAMGGLPLGLEIAASQLAYLSLEELVVLAEVSPHTLQAEHQTVGRHRSLAQVALEAWQHLGPTPKVHLVKLTNASEPFAEPSDAAHVQVGTRDLRYLVRKGFLYRCAEGCYHFPLPFRRFVGDIAGAQ